VTLTLQQHLHQRALQTEHAHGAGDAATAGQKFAQEHTKVLLRDILYEDLSTLEWQHKAMKSGVLAHLPLSEMELAVRHQMHTVQEWVQRP